MTLAVWTTSPTLWYLNRATGAVVLVLLTASLLLGVLSTRATAGGRLPAFVRHDLHRSISLVAVVLLAAHVATAVGDEYVDIRWWQAFSPVGATYRPLWLGLGALALDLMVVATITGLLHAAFRSRPRAWRALHLTSYAAWGLALAHGLGTGTDPATAPGRWLTWACAGVVAFAVLVRLVGRTTRSARARRAEPAR